MKEEDIEAKAKAWDGKDFRGERCNPFAVTFMKEHPKVFEWLSKRPKNTIGGSCGYLRQFCAFSNLTPDDFLALTKKKARDKAWKYIDSVRIEHPAKAVNVKKYLKSFYLYHNEEPLVFILGKHDIDQVTKRLKYTMDKPTCWKIIHKTRNLRDETILTFAFESGLRQNAIAHMTFGHYKNFMWFKITKDGDIMPSNEYEGNIAIFKVMAAPYPEYTYDEKLRKVGIDWYYAFLHKEATKILKEYVNQYHQGSKDDSPLWYPLMPMNKHKRLSNIQFLHIVKDCVKRAGLPVDQINFHAMRRGFRSVVRNSPILDNEFKEAIMGHKLKGSQEAYFDKPVIQFARRYAKCDFSPPAPEKDELLARREKEIEILVKRQSELEEKLEKEKARVTTEVEVESFEEAYKKVAERPQATQIQIQKALEEQSTPQTVKTEARPPTKPLSKPLIVKDQVEQPKETEKPKATGYSSFASLKQKPGDYITCTKTKQAYKLEDLPCMVDVNLICDNDMCKNQIMKLIK